MKYKNVARKKWVKCVFDILVYKSSSWKKWNQIKEPSNIRKAKSTKSNLFAKWIQRGSSIYNINSNGGGGGWEVEEEECLDYYYYYFSSRIEKFRNQRC